MGELLYAIVFKVYRLLLGGQKKQYLWRPGTGRSWTEEKGFLDSLGIPNSDIEASFFQYKCEKFSQIDAINYIFLNGACFFAFFPMVIFFLIKKYIHRKFNYRRNVVTASFLLKEKLIPSELMNQDSSPVVMNKGDGMLTVDDLRFLSKIIRLYPLSFFFVSKCVYLIAAYSGAIQKYHPAVIFCSAEYSFTSSVLTMYCEQRGIKHCNIMHGPPVCRLSYSFARFSKFYVWDSYFVQVFKTMKSRTLDSDFIIYPLRIPEVAVSLDETTCTYYLQIPNRKELEKIKFCLEKMGRKYKIRPHPLYNYPMIYEFFDEGCIESPTAIDTWRSIGRAGMVISQYSTTLYQAYLLHIPIVIDDVSNPSLVKEMEVRQHIMFHKPHLLLSEIIGLQGGIV